MGELREQVTQSSIPSIIIKQPPNISSQLEKDSSEGVSWLKIQEVREVLNIPLPHAGGGYLENPAQPLPRGYRLPKRPALSRFFVLRGSRRGVAGMEDRSKELLSKDRASWGCGPDD